MTFLEGIWTGWVAETSPEVKTESGKSFAQHEYEVECIGQRGDCHQLTNHYCENPTCYRPVCPRCQPSHKC